jgi:hypothetical protein
MRTRIHERYQAAGFRGRREREILPEACQEWPERSGMRR